MVMHEKFIPEFCVIGIAVRTTNANGQSARDLEALWGKFWGEEVFGKIPGKLSDEIYAVYTDYETDFTGAYTAFIGGRVNNLDHIPEGFSGLIIHPARYQKFVSKGKMPDAILKTWMEIWGDEELNSKRAYRADFTVHGEKYFLGEQAEVETFISVT